MTSILSVMDLPAEFYLQTVSHRVPAARAAEAAPWSGRASKVDPSAIRHTAMLTVEGELDDISAPGQTRAAHKIVSGLPRISEPTTSRRASATTAFSTAVAGASRSCRECATSS